MGLTNGDLSDILRRRNVREVHYFHADHWEPWRANAAQVPRDAPTLMRFLDETAKLAHSSKLSLFYKVNVPHHPVASGTPDLTTLPGDEIGFKSIAPEFRKIVSECLGHVLNSNHELQVHVHHEAITNGDYFQYGHWKWDQLENNCENDSRRFELYLSLLLKEFESDAKTKIENWGFVHGLWSLNGADPRVCSVIDEIEILMRHGCIADFSMPAGREIVNSMNRMPFTCIPVAAPKGYDFPEADSFPVGQTPPADQKRFLVWNQEIPTQFCSLDYYSKPVMEAISDTEHYLGVWLKKAFVLDGVMFIKTHAHSMNVNYDATGYFPHCHPKVIELFERLESVCDNSNVNLHYSTTNEVLQALYGLDANLEVALLKGSVPEAITVSSNRFFDASKVKRWDAFGLQLASGESSVLDVESLGNYYVRRFEKQQFFSVCDMEIAKYVLMTFPVEGRQIFESGPGCCTGVLLLWLLGYRCHVIEANNKRFVAATIIRDQFIQEFQSQDQSGNDLLIERAIFPDTKPIQFLKQSPNSLVVSTNVISKLTTEREERILDAFSKASDLLFDLGSFAVIREEEEKRVLEERILSRGFVKQRTVYRKGRVEIAHFKHID